MTVILNLLGLFILSVLVLSAIKQPILNRVVSLTASFLIVLQLLSLLIGGSLIDYKFFVHANWNDVVTMVDMYILEALVATVVFLVLPPVLDFIIRKTRILQEQLSRRQVGLLFGVSISVMFLNGGIINNGIGVLKVLTASSVNFEVALRDLKMSSYVPSDRARGKRGRNIIILSLESYEKGFLSDKKAHLTPNLRQLASKWSLVDMKETIGCNWTSGSLYGAMTGLPAFFKGDGNAVFQQSSSTKVANLGQILKTAGYNTSFLVGDARFAGTSDLLRVFEFDKIVDGQNIAQLYGSNFTTAHDKDLFDAAKIEVANLKKSGQPFAMMLSTFDTHNPNGVYDNRFENILQPQPTELEFMISAIDHMIGDFIDFLDKEKLLENTTVFIFPDHLKMGDATILDGTGERSLFVLTNASRENLKIEGTQPIYQIDLPGVILNGSSVEHNARFLTEYIDGNKNEFIKTHTASLTALNHAGLVRENIWDDELRVVRADTSVRIHLGEKLLHISADSLRSHVARLRFSSEMRLQKTEYHLMNKDVLPAFADGLTVNVYSKNDTLFGYIQVDTRLPVTKVATNELTFTQEDIKTAQLAPFQVDPHKPVNRFVHWEEREDWEIPGVSGKEYHDVAIAIPYFINEGFLEVTYTADVDAKPFVIFFGQPYTPARVLLHDPVPVSASKKTVRFPIQRSLDNSLLIFRNWSQRGSFIVHSYQILGSGYQHDTRLSSPSANVASYTKDVSRFIAHAGGAIDGISYTNSLEALDANYAKGFRMFELDIIKTSDGKFVAAHDWKYWAGLTGYNGPLPPTESEFLNHKILKKYTPLDMDRINQWFAGHKDAILVTDKINEPKTFTQHFIDRKRLMMELFTLEAVREGLATGMLSAMPSESVLGELSPDRAGMLKKLGVKTIALSRVNIVHYIPLLQRLKSAGIKVYAYDVNHELGKDEKFTVTYEMDYIYGIYADKWEFQ